MRRNDNVIFTLKVMGITAILCLAVLLTMRYVAMRSIVDGMSMYPTLWDQEHVIVNKRAYKAKAPERFDIVIFKESLSQNGYFIKRIIGLPGETVQIDYEGNIYINGAKLEESYGFQTIKDPGRAILPVKLGDEEYFVLGDNRNHSTDSRAEEIGSIDINRFLGKVTLRTLPIEKFGYIDLYMERTQQ